MENLPQETLERALGGDAAAFAAVVREHQGMVFGLAKRFLRDASAAEELAQDVFLQLFQNLHAIRSREHLTFWLRRTTSHRCIDRTRRRLSRPSVSLDETPEPRAEAPRGDPLLAELLRQLVSALPETPRMVVVLRYQEDLDPAEIASILGMPVSTVKSHLRRSLALLREKVARRVGKVYA